MNAIRSSSVPTDPTVVPVLAALSVRRQAGRASVGTGRRRSVALVDEPGAMAPRRAWGQWPDGPAAAAAPHENVNVQGAGLCRRALDASLAAQQQAKQALDRAIHRAMGHSTIQPKEDPNHGKS